MIDRYFQRFPGIQRYIHETLESVREKGYSETLFGRKTWFPRINSKNQAERARARARRDQRADPGHQRRHHQARDGADDARAGRGGPGHVKMLLQVHDELVFELPEAGSRPPRRDPQVMAEAALPAVELSVPLGVEIGTGPSWDAAH
jgi:DNA polymerase I